MQFPQLLFVAIRAAADYVSTLRLPARRVPLVLPMAVIFAVWTLVPTPTRAETWTALRGNHSVDAELLGIWEGNAILKMSDGRRVSVPLINLISDSRIHANKVNETIQTHRAELVSELKAQAAEAAAPAPTPLPQPPAAPEYRPLDKGATAIETLQHLQDQSASGHLLLAYFDSLPPKYRADLDGIVKAGAQKLDAASIDSTVGPLYRAADLVVTHQNWIFSHPRMKMLDANTREILRTLLLNAAGAIRATLDPAALTTEKLDSMQLRDWLVQRDSAVAPHLYAINSVLPSTAATFEEYDASQQNQYDPYGEESGYGTESSMEIAELSGEEGPPGDSPVQPDAATPAKPESNDAKIKVTQNGRSVILDMVRVDGYWIPKSLSENWKESVASKKEKAAASGLMSLVDSPAITAVGSMLQPTIDTLSSANTAEEFHQAMETVFQQAQTFASVLGGLAGNSSEISNPWQPAKSSRSSHNSDGYTDEEYREEMEMQYNTDVP
ncbi:hypothetical protein RMSM_04363 [Rhodopirellula maiorica SM1]|uniref:SLA1 homology domain-containing protein n=1 Tax=Rhodopirellula maiorica SM1 TaxID=1265738 RepID=M5RTL9_9BACT|nr:hypothetical protein [Rhodopirellula maiorica]EMI18732.1 hypothetical protein RMSM_04363 [Rhodopirellula maiorica SM1]